MNVKTGSRPVIFGEVLFDLFPGGVEILGGAPFNVAWNLAMFGLDPLFISRVGDDRRGETVLETMRECGMDTSGVQVDNEKQTGAVEVKMDDSSHTFDILPDQAYDHIEPSTGAIREIENGSFSLLYHGTLINRSGKSAMALQTISSSSNLPAFVDVNLRKPWSGGDSARKAIKGARWVKLNNEELEQIMGACATDGENLEALAEYFRAETGVELLMVTKGEQGAFFATESGIDKYAPGPVADVIDAVGAGDAFSAVVITGLILRWSPETMLKRAVSFAADICRIRGATSADRSIYRSHCKNWGL